MNGLCGRGPHINWKVGNEYDTKEQCDGSEWKEEVKDFTFTPIAMRE